MARQPIPEMIRAAVLERDENCQKCMRADGLNVHHIISRDEGGTDDLDNLIILCEICHYEWEWLVHRTPLTFLEWMQVPPLINMLTIYLYGDFWTDDITAKEAKRRILAMSEKINLALRHQGRAPRGRRSKGDVDASHRH